ncbi:MAG: anthranilate synthase component I family protein [Cytophagaceae bacterium]|nr:anthranilate synthase component I family protein [Cytophagaceae bacterium]
MRIQKALSSQHLLAYAAAHFDTYCYLNGNNITYPHGAFPRIIGIGIEAEYLAVTEQDFSWKAMDAFIQQHQGQHIFSYINYGLKNHIEYFSERSSDPLAFPFIHLYVPHYLFVQEDDQSWQAYDKKSEALLPALLASSNDHSLRTQETQASAPVAQFSHDEYIAIIQRIKAELAQGNIYEINFCNSYSGACKNINYTSLYEELNSISPMPFSALYKHKEHVLLSASPERFIQKKNNQLVSQPIKGTAGRLTNTADDQKQKQYLEESLKERTENIMIVDLVRNDLSKVCMGGSVMVEELCRVYTFEKVHQMISTITGELEKTNIPFSELLQALFPMGSMTGAPKLKAMKLIDELEKEARGLFSGTVGYIQPNGDFDFNVIIRSLLFNEKKGWYKFHAGSAITMASDAELEYQECDVKTLPIRLLLQNLR